jgi:hypothetical protein
MGLYKKLGWMRLRAICGPALTGSTVAWGILEIVLDGKNMWSPGLEKLALIWLATIAMGTFLASFQKLSLLAASIVSTLIGTTAVSAYTAVPAYASHYAGEKAAGASDMALAFFILYLVIVAIVGLIWVPLVFLNSRRHCLHADAARGAPSHA